ncbi:SWF or SNF family helicase [Streptomyces sp. NPDC001941]|uniref:SWIM zinc finger family protein n=1 Tax=Streptomyces sp. NPDC001941 TaxID=3154659 RepID=UPI003326861F
MNATDDWYDDSTPRSADGNARAGSLERIFDALPPAQGRGFARTWWGQAWLQALEGTALDGQQLKNGRKHARAGAVGAVSVRPGRITAVVRDRDGTAQRSDVLLREFEPEEWDRLLDMAAERAEYIAALLDRDMPPHLVEDAAQAGIELLPGIGDLEPHCGCDAWDHCHHTAALCYQVARLLDQDPFVLLLMRGRAERALLDELQVRSAARAALPHGQEPSGQAVPPGVRADEAFAARDILPPLPAPPALPPGPGQVPSLDTETAPGPGLDPAALEFLAARAAEAAHRMLADALAPGHADSPLETEPTVSQDAVRLAYGRPDRDARERLATGTGRRTADLDTAVAAWEYGGAAALAVLEEQWEPSPEDLARARTALETAWDEGEDPQLRRAGPARWTVPHDGVQLRLGQDGRWWPYRKDRGRWVPSGPAAADPATALEQGRREE